MIVALVLFVVLAGAAFIAAALRLAVGSGAARVAVVAPVAAVLVMVLVTMVAGLDVGGDDDGRAEEAAEPVERTPRAAYAPLRQPTVRLSATAADALPPVPTRVGDLESGSVMVLRLAALDGGSTATVHQCRAGALDASDCRPGLPVNVGEEGQATVLVDLEERFRVGRDRREVVDCGREECSIVVFGTSRLEVVTVFGRPAPRPITVSADPSALPPGGTLTATAERLPPGAWASFVVCRPGGQATADCGRPTDAQLVERSGRVSAPVLVSPGRCSRGAACAVAVVVGDSGPRAFARVQLTGRSGAAYDGSRLGAGIAIAGLLLVAALVLLRRTDWTPVGGDPFAGVEVTANPFRGEGDR